MISQGSAPSRTLPDSQAATESIPALPITSPSTSRLVSLDVFRGLVIVVMTFVNYLSPVKDIPAWAKHRPAELEGYTFVDVVFPAFLFMVGIAIPFALQRRLDRGDSLTMLLGKITLRCAGLLLLGVITANEHLYAADVAMLSKPLWFFLALSFGIAMCTPLPIKNQNLRVGIQGAAAIGLLVFLCLYRGKNEAGNITWLQHSYWGMLGMIGWAYLACCLCWLVYRDNSTALMGIMGFMLALFIGGKHGMLNWLEPIAGYINVGINFGTNAATVMMGVLVGNCLRNPATATKPWTRLTHIFIFGVGLYLAGCLMRPLHGINKSAHTDSYGLVTGGICCVVFAVVYLVVDILQARRGSGALVPIGQNALLAYLLPYLVANLCGVLGLNLYWANSGWAGAWNAAAMTVVLLALTWVLSRFQFRMRL